MLALSSLKNSNVEDRDATTGGFSVEPFLADDDFLDNIDFSGIFEGFGFDGDILPDLQTPEPPMDILSESSAEGREQEADTLERSEKGEKTSRVTPAASMKPESRRTTLKGSHGKKKVKVDWTPDLHRRFVMAVEELGVDKAVPSRILEIMGSLNLTRHNVASHLQKYRSQRKHSLAREAEAGSWSQRRQRYAAVAAFAGSTDSSLNKENVQWISPTLGFPSPSLQPQLRPLHVWGHPTVDRSPLMPAMWQGHAVPLAVRPPPWPQPPNYFAYWRPPFHACMMSLLLLFFELWKGSGEGWGPSAVIPPPHYLPQPLLGVRFVPPPVAGLPSPQMYSPQQWPPPLIHHLPDENAHPSSESIDAAIGDVLAKPWLPLPLGLKPPSTDSVLGELHRQGVAKVPPGCNPEQK